MNSTSPKEVGGFARPEDAPRWYFNDQRIDLEHWLMGVSTSPLGGQDSPAYADPEGNLVCAFHAGFEPSHRNGRMLAASLQMYRLLQQVRELPQLPAAVSEQINSVLNEIDSAPAGHPR